MQPTRREAYFPVLIILTIAAFLLFYRTLNRSFVSDDFFVLRRLCLLDSFWIQGFFRPIGDVTLIWTYQLFGFEPTSVYYGFNVLLHAMNASLVYLLCLRGPWFRNIRTTEAAVVAAFLFLAYPFHSESILWSISRSSSFGCFFGLLSLVAYYGSRPHKARLITSAICYFLGLACFENIFLLPLIIGWNELRERRSLLPSAGIFSIALLAHLAVRIHFSGVIFGSYGETMFTPSATDYLAKILKVSGRIFVPPSDNPRFSIIISAVIFAGWALIGYRFYKRGGRTAKDFADLWLYLLISLVIPYLFGLSTRTPEGDRLLYFPSVFVCLIITAATYQLVRWRPVRNGIIIAVLVAEIALLIPTQDNWNGSSDIVQNILTTVRDNRKASHNISLVDLPEDYNGAFIFRNGFYDALLMNGIDTSGIRIHSTIALPERSARPAPPKADSGNLVLYWDGKTMARSTQP